jgi:transcriptional regulator with XRE-family HTH domain
MTQEVSRKRLQKLHNYLQSVCGLYSRVARRFGVDRSYVSRVARGERRSEDIESALITEFERTKRA